MCFTVTSRIASEYQQMCVWLSVSLREQLCCTSIGVTRIEEKAGQRGGSENHGCMRARKLIAADT